VSRLTASLAAQDQEVLLEFSLHDRPLLEKTIQAFYARHGGLGAAIVAAGASTFRPFKCAQ
jgi:hypothetical protein